MRVVLWGGVRVQVCQLYWERCVVSCGLAQMWCGRDSQLSEWCACVRACVCACMRTDPVQYRRCARCRYWHRSLNPRKLIDVKFSHLTRNMTMQRTLKLYKLPEVRCVCVCVCVCVCMRAYLYVCAFTRVCA